MFEIFNYTPELYFFAGFILGYLLRGLINRGTRKPRVGRYHSVKVSGVLRERELGNMRLKEPLLDGEIGCSVGSGLSHHAVIVLDRSGRES